MLVDRVTGDMGALVLGVKDHTKFDAEVYRAYCTAHSSEEPNRVQRAQARVLLENENENELDVANAALDSL